MNEEYSTGVVEHHPPYHRPVRVLWWVNKAYASQWWVGARLDREGAKERHCPHRDHRTLKGAWGCVLELVEALVAEVCTARAAGGEGP